MAKDKKEICEAHYFDKNKAASVKEKMKPEETIRKISETFKVLGDSTRIKIIHALSQEELCVCDISNILGATNSAVSHQLRVLRNMRLVKYRREGKMAYYSLDDAHIENLFNQGLKHVEEK